MGLAVWILAVSLFGIGLYFILLYFQTRQILDAKIEIAQKNFYIGRPLKFTLHLTANKETKIDELKISIYCLRLYRPRADSINADSFLTDQLLDSIISRGTKISLPFLIEKDFLCIAEGNINYKKLLKKNQKDSFKGEITIPNKGMPSNNAGKLTIHWVLEAKINVPGMPTFLVKKEIWVRRKTHHMVDDPEYQETAEKQEPPIDPAYEISKMIKQEGLKKEDTSFDYLEIKKE